MLIFASKAKLLGNTNGSFDIAKNCYSISGFDYILECYHQSILTMSFSELNNNYEVCTWNILVIKVFLHFMLWPGLEYAFSKSKLHHRPNLY